MAEPDFRFDAGRRQVTAGAPPGWLVVVIPARGHAAQRTQPAVAGEHPHLHLATVRHASGLGADGEVPVPLYPLILFQGRPSPVQASSPAGAESRPRILDRLQAFIVFTLTQLTLGIAQCLVEFGARGGILRS
ncbi:hypothetical protein ACFQU7_38895 [Pseudoroseomonas wenyumeiae]